GKNTSVGQIPLGPPHPLQLRHPRNDRANIAGSLERVEPLALALLRSEHEPPLQQRLQCPSCRSRLLPEHALPVSERLAHELEHVLDVSRPMAHRRVALNCGQFAANM